MSVLRLTPPAVNPQPGLEGISLHQRELFWRLGWFVRVRWVAIVGLVLGAVYGRLCLGPCISLTPVFLFLGGIAAYNLAFTLIYSLMLGLPRPMRRYNVALALAQICADLAMLTLLVHATGGIHSPFVILYVIHMVMSGMLLRRWACYLVALVASVALDATAGLVASSDAAFWSLAPKEAYGPAFPVLHLCLFFNAVFFVTAAMTSSITDRLRQRERDVEAINWQVAEVNVAKSRFMRAASHEMRSPLAAIHGLLEMLASRIADPERIARATAEAHPLHLIERCKIRVRYLLELVNDLLEYSCLQSVSTQEERNSLDLAAVVGAAVEELEPVARTEGIALTAEVQPCRVLGDEQQLLTLSKNLIGNALRYTPAGGQVAVRVGPVGRQAMFEVEDNGIGVDAMSLPFIFDEFFRAPNAKEYEAAGTGLGLTMCKSIAEHHDGTIAVSSEPNRSTIFTVRLPLHERR